MADAGIWRFCSSRASFSTLAQKGFRVIGVDRTAFLLEKARMRAEAAQVEIGWVQEDMREFTRPGALI